MHLLVQLLEAFSSEQLLHHDDRFSLPTDAIRRERRATRPGPSIAGQQSNSGSRPGESTCEENLAARPADQTGARRALTKRNDKQ
ncbi:MAG TPA: hypothetical protein VGE52_05980, partial [Pirellulales bacterium]